MPVLAVERRRRILRSLERSPAITTDEFAAELGVSPETVRRDLIELERRGMLRRVHGGAAALVRLAPEEPEYSERALEQSEAKRAIGAAAAAMVVSGQTVVIDVGTTSLEVARADPAAGHEHLDVRAGPPGRSGLLRHGDHRVLR